VIRNLKHQAVLAVKNLLFGRHGEPYRIGGATLRFAPGTRPVLTKYRSSPNTISRHDALQVELVSEILGPGDFAVDIGAHAGQYALIMAARCGPTGRVIAFEPDAHALKKFTRNLDLNKNMPRPTVESLALSDRSGSATLYSRGGDSNSSLSLSGLPSMAIEDLEQMDVTLTTLDDYLDKHGLPVPKLVKIDTEGAEIRILSGAETLLASDAEILCELHPYAWEGFGSSFEELQGLLAKCGRQMRYIDQDKPVEGDPDYGVVVLERQA
jgi:FkbM family methyltransferase